MPNRTDEYTYGDYLNEAANEHRAERNQTGTSRYGQHLFNVLHLRRPDISEQIRGTKFDPFHKTGEELSPEFYKHISDLW